MLVGALFVSERWLAPVQAAMGALWPTVLGCGLLTYARYVTYVTNEADREKRVVRKSRWMTRITEFATQVNEMAREEWQVYLARREQAKSSVPINEPLPAAVVAAQRVRSEASERATAPLRKMQAQVIEPIDASEDAVDLSAPATRAANLRPLKAAAAEEAEIEIPSATPAIPAPHFPISAGESEPDYESGAERSASRKERKKARRA